MRKEKNTSPPLSGRSHGRFRAKEKPKNTKRTVLRLWNYLGINKRSLLGVFILVVLSSVFTLIGPLLIGIAIDDYIIPKDIKGLIVICIVLILVYITGSIITFIQNNIMINIAQNTVKEIRKDIFNKVQSLPLEFLDKTPHGDVMSRMTNDIENVSQILNTSVTHIFSSIIILIGTIMMMSILSPILMFVTVLIIPLVIIFTGIVARYTRGLFKDQQKSLGELNGYIEEIISSEKIVKIFCREDDVISQFHRSNDSLKTKAIKAQIFSGIMPPMMNVFNNLSFALVAGVGGYLAVRQIITVGVIASFINYAKQFSRPLNEMANQINMIQSALAGTERIFEIIDEETESIDKFKAVELKDVKGSVEFKNVSFGYKKDTPVLQDFNFKVEPGQTVALVGPTGAGKTTVVNVLTRFYDIDNGCITIDGYDIEVIKRDNLRSMLGIVLQDTYLFSESIRENIRYGNLCATDQEVEEAAKLANAHNFINQMDKGYDTTISEDAENLSQGQKQLIAIARAILSDPSILILDEATSNVDTLTEIHIRRGMQNLMKRKTSFVIAHRLSTIKNADLIIVIDNGRIIEKGNHEELILRKGYYYRLYNNQYS